MSETLTNADVKAMQISANPLVLDLARTLLEDRAAFKALHARHCCRCTVLPQGNCEAAEQIGGWERK